MFDEEAVRRMCKFFRDNMCTVEEFAANFQWLMFSNRGMPERVLNVPMPMPSWAIDAGRD